MTTLRHFGRRCRSNMILAFALALGALLVATSEGCERHGAKCPEYTVLQTHEDYEERRYPSLVWVSASGSGKSKSDVSRKLIKKLYSYLGGANSKGMNLDMMVPVRTKKVVHEGFNTYTMAIPLRPEQSHDPLAQNVLHWSETRDYLLGQVLRWIRASRNHLG
ncbi:hypothetical protein HNY73_004925 [Argiope bruennichi]|uniref:Uncharacterized protein n=1 Tax=Argiope bruennichi TaxID=94029 RepID=A0A8T0FRJ3_ARGBR|nr:hypothetical protein HNY73_004925 [Argiope bruennichi]